MWWLKRKFENYRNAENGLIKKIKMIAENVKMKTKLNTIPNLLRILSAYLLLYEIFLLYLIKIKLIF